MPPSRRHKSGQRARAKVPVTLDSTKRAPPAAASTVKLNNQLIRRYHTLNKQLAHCEAVHDTAKAATLRDELQSLGGLAAYQEASAKGASVVRGGDTSRWLVKVLTPLRPTTTTTRQCEKWRLLDVGALAADNYRREQVWIEADAMDLHSRDPQIRQADFITEKPPAQPEQRYDIVCLSLVVNFVGDARLRGAMLRRVIDWLRPSGPGYLFVVLPLPCLTNSRYLDHDRWLAMLRAVGLANLVDHHNSSRLAYYLFQRPPPQEQGNIAAASLAENVTVFPKQEIHPGAGRNNFCIILD